LGLFRIDIVSFAHNTRLRCFHEIRLYRWKLPQLSFDLQCSCFREVREDLFLNFWGGVFEREHNIVLRHLAQDVLKITVRE
jgi:hypothetical protein